MIRSNRSARARFIRAAQRKMDINESRSGRRFLTKAEARRIFNRVKEDEDVEECDAQKEDDEADTTEVSESRRRLAARRRREAYRRGLAAGRRAALKEDDEEVPADDVPADDGGDVDADAAAADTDIDAGGDAPVDDASADVEGAPTIQDMVNNISVQLNDIKQTLGMTVESDLGPDADADVGDTLPESKSVLGGARRRLEARRRSMLRNRKSVKEGIAFADDISHRADGFAMSTKKGYSKTVANGSLGKKAPEPKISDNELANGTEKNVVRWGKDATDLDTKKPYAKANVDTDAEIDKYISSLKGQKQVESILKSFSRS